MLPVVLIGDNQARIKQLEQSFPAQMPAPLRVLEVSKENSALLPLPALTAASIVLIDVDDSFAPSVGQYIARLRAAYPDSAVVVLLPFGDDADESAAVRSGADDVLVKPLTPHRLSLSMRNLSELVRLRAAVNIGDKNLSASMRMPIGQLGISLVGSNGQVKKYHHLEQEIIRSTIAFFDGHISKAARALGIGRSTLYRKIDMQTLESLNRSA